MENTGLFFILKNFNDGLYSLFAHAPLYVGKVFIGAFYGVILGIVVALWKKEIFYNGFGLICVLVILNKFNCIDFNWTTIYSILGVSSLSFSSEALLLFVNEYSVEISLIIIVGIFVKKTIYKYNHHLSLQ